MKIEICLSNVCRVRLQIQVAVLLIHAVIPLIQVVP